MSANAFFATDDGGRGVRAGPSPKGKAAIWNAESGHQLTLKDLPTYEMARCETFANGTRSKGPATSPSRTITENQSTATVGVVGGGLRRRKSENNDDDVTAGRAEDGSDVWHVRQETEELETDSKTVRSVGQSTESRANDGESSTTENGYDRSHLTGLGCDAECPDPEQAMADKRRAVKNMVLVSIAFLLNFNAFQGLSRLQSSLNGEEGIGVLTSSVIYASLVVSCMFAPKVLINLFGHKWTMVVSFFGYILWLASNGYATWGTLMPTSILVGLVAAPLWTAQCSYFTLLGQQYAELNGETVETALSRFFGMFFMFFQLSSVTGSIISSTVLKPEYVNPNDTHSVDLTLCGHDDCPWNNSTTNANLKKPNSTTVWIMVGVYIAIACFAVLLIALFVDNLPEKLCKKGQIKKEILSNLVATFKHLRHGRQLLIIPLTMYSGFEQAFFNAEWCKSYISCSLGIWKVGLVTLPFGLVNVVVSITNGQIVKYTGRIPIFILATIVDLAVHFTMLFWEIEHDQEYIFYILSACWGLTDGIWQTQIHSLYGCLFGDESEAAFSNHRMWESVGFIIAFAYSNYLCTSVKLTVLKAIVCVGMAGYFVVEWLEWRRHELNLSETAHGGSSSESPEMVDFKMTPSDATEFRNCGRRSHGNNAPGANQAKNSEEISAAGENAAYEPDGPEQGWPTGDPPTADWRPSGHLSR